MKRKSIGKRLRFSIFERDGFQCQYCGKTPEHDVVLHVDHIVSVKDGGTNEKENLVTSCRDCNLGKSSKSITKRKQTEEDIKQSLAELEDRLEQLQRLTKYRQKIQQQKIKISSLERQQISEVSDREYTENLLEKLCQIKQGVKEEGIFFNALQIVESKFPVGSGVTQSTYLSYLRGIIRNLELPQEYSLIIREYNNTLFSYDRMDKRTRGFILDYADLGIEFHQDVIKLIQKFQHEKHSETYKLRDEVANVFGVNNLTIYKSGINLQLLVCDTIILKLEEYE